MKNKSHNGFQIKNLGFVLCADGIQVTILADGLPYPYCVVFDSTDTAEVAKCHILIDFFNSGIYRESGHTASILVDSVNGDGDNTVSSQMVTFMYDYF